MKKLLLAITSFLLFIPIIKAQFSYTAASASSSLQTYTDLGSSGNAITTNFSGSTMGYYRNISSIQDIGFSFNFNGTNYTQFVLSSSGFIKLGTTAPLSTLTSPFSSETNVIYPISISGLTAGSSAEYRVSTTGVLGARICTIQFKGLTDTSTTVGYVKQFSSLEYQLKLYESSNKIEFVYGNFVPTGNTGLNYVFANGIKGNDLLSFVNSSGRSANWASDNFVDTFAGSQGLKYLNGKYFPAAGLIYTFNTSTLPASDAKVQIVYTLSKIAVNNPHQIKAMVRNNGANPMINLPVTLSVSGANEFTDVQYISSLAPGSTTIVTFASYTPINVGDNNVSVSVPADDVPANNEIVRTETVTVNSVSNTSGLATNYGAISYGNGSDAAILVENTGAKVIDSLKTYTSFSFDKKFVVGIYTYTNNGPGTALWKSDSIVSLQGFNFISVPNISVNGKFFVVITQGAGTNYAIAYETEFPLRDSFCFVRTPANTGKWVVERGLTTLSNSTKYIADVFYTSTLPVKLLDFTVNEQAQNATLHFSTGNEETLTKIEIERSTNGTDWDKLASLDAKGNATVNKYQYTDAGLSTGKWYYRLKLIEKDGTVTFSKVINIEVTTTSAFAVYNYPNPAKTNTIIYYSLANNATVSLALYTIEGKMIKAFAPINQYAGNNKIDLNVAGLSLPSGEYMYKLLVTDAKTNTTTTYSKQLSVIR